MNGCWEKEDKRLAWYSWEKMELPKCQGGMGFRNIHSFNIALLAKQGWRLINYPNSLLARVLKDKHYKNSSFLDAGLGSNPSVVWKSLLKGRELIKRECWWSVGNGKQVGKGEQRWIPKKNIGLEVQAPIQGNSTKVEDLINKNTKRWKVSLVRNLFTEEEASRILAIPISWCDMEDSIQWPHVSSGKYTVKSGSQIASQWLRKGAGNSKKVTNKASSSFCFEEFYWKVLWGSKLPKKILHFWWRMSHDILPLKSNLWKRKCSDDKICPICDCKEETLDHLLWECDWTRPMWIGLGVMIDEQILEFQSVRKWLVMLAKGVLDKLLLPAQLHRIVMGCWVIWLTRNAKVFEHKNPNPNSVVFHCESLLSWLDIYKGEQGAEKIKQVKGIVASRNRWFPPKPPWLKCNFDASWNAGDGKAYISWVVRNDKGEVLDWGWSSEFAISALVAEALALRLAAWKVKNRYPGAMMQFEGDNKILIEACKNGQEIQDCQILQKDFWFLKEGSNWSISWVSRILNCLADRIVNRVKDVNSGCRGLAEDICKWAKEEFE